MGSAMHVSPAGPDGFGGGGPPGDMQRWRIRTRDLKRNATWKGVIAMETGPHSSARAFIKRHAVVIFYVLVFTLGFGPALILGGPGVFFDSSNFLGAGAEPATAADLGPLGIAAILSGPPMYALIAILIVALAYGKAGLHDLRSRISHWRVGARWYAVAFLTAPILWIAIQGGLSFTSSVYVPGILTAGDKAGLLLTALVAGLVAGFFEEIAWTGFATHELLKRHGVLVTGVIVGLLWCLLHLPLYAGASSGDLPRELAIPVGLFAWLLPYRVLMVWVYGCTHSLLIAMLMHFPISAMAFLLGSAAMAGMPDLVFNLIFGVTLWGIVAVAFWTDRRKNDGGTFRRRPFSVC